MRLSYYVMQASAFFFFIPLAVYSLLVATISLYFEIKCRHYDFMNILAYIIILLTVIYMYTSSFMKGGRGITLNMPAYMSNKGEKYSGKIISVVEATDDDTNMRDIHKYYIEGYGNTSEFLVESQYIHMVHLGDNIVAYRFPFSELCHIFKVNERDFTERHRGGVFLGTYFLLAWCFWIRRRRLEKYGEISEVIKKLYLAYVFGIGISLLLLTGKCYLLLYILWFAWYLDIITMSVLLALTETYIDLTQGTLGVYPEKEIECGMHKLTKKEVLQFYLGAFLS